MKLFMLLANSFCKRFVGSIIVLAIVMLFPSSAGSVFQVPWQELEGKQVAKIAGVEFAAPRGFKREKSSADRVAFMRHATSQTALFIAVPDHSINDRYLTDLSQSLVSQLFPQESGFAWKIVHGTSDRKMSVYQTSGGTTKGLNTTKYVQADYLVVKAQGHEVVVGSIATFGEEGEAKFLFEVEGTGYSLLGWQALFQLIPSITGERLDDNNGRVNLTHE
jgi:hypothetical protein